MQCKTCDYPLWNLKARLCPECGEPFLPSEHEFVLNSVRFCCPHCNQAYYGTSEKGHLVPSAFTCVNCAQPIAMDEMVLLPAEGVHEHQTYAQRAPWLDRPRVGVVKAWFGTVFQALFLPNRLIRGVPATSSVGQAGGFAAITAALFAIVHVIPLMAFIALMAFAFAGMGGGRGGGGGSGPVLTMGWVTMLMIVSVWAAILILLAIWALVTHGLLLITGGANHPISRTFHAICYSIGGAAFIGVPLLGFYFAFVPLLWWMVSAMIMVSIGQGVHPGRAIFATAVVPLLVLGTFIAGFIALIAYSTVGARASIAQQMTASTSFTGQIMASDLVASANALGGEYPPFALALVVSGIATPEAFVSDYSYTDVASVYIGEKSLFDLAMLPDDELQATITAVAEAMPGDVVAHRIGDVVFTYHGMEVDATDNTLWIMVIAPPPGNSFGAVTYSPDFPDQVTVVTADGATVSHPVDQFDAALEAQNATREAHGLPPLPDPLAITLRQPVVRATGEHEAFPAVSLESEP